MSNFQALKTHLSIIALGLSLLFALPVAYASSLLPNADEQSDPPTRGSIDETEAAPRQRIVLPGYGKIDYQRLFEAVSETGESLDDFALRISSKLVAYSAETGFEACGWLATDGNRFGVVIGTNRSHIACVNRAFDVPAGMAAIEDTIHSHGHEERFRANQNDRVLHGTTFHGRDRRGTRKTVAGQNVREFSTMDFNSGPGYLATPEGVKHQRGQGTEREILRVIPPPSGGEASLHGGAK